MTVKSYVSSRNAIVKPVEKHGTFPADVTVVGIVGTVEQSHPAKKRLIRYEENEL